MDPKGDPTPPKMISCLQALVDDTYGAFFGPNIGTLGYKEIFYQEVRVIDRALDIPGERTRQVATTTAPAMTFAQFMELAMTTVLTVASISPLMATTTENATSIAMPIASLVELNKANETYNLTLGNQIRDINKSVSTAIICLKKRNRGKCVGH
jgi:hypothetical protein